MLQLDRTESPYTRADHLLHKGKLISVSQLSCAQIPTTPSPNPRSAPRSSATPTSPETEKTDDDRNPTSGTDPTPRQARLRNCSDQVYTHHRAIACDLVTYPTTRTRNLCWNDYSWCYCRWCRHLESWRGTILVFVAAPLVRSSCC